MIFYYFIFHYSESFSKEAREGKWKHLFIFMEIITKRLYYIIGKIIIIEKNTPWVERIFGGEMKIQKRRDNTRSRIFGDEMKVQKRRDKTGRLYIDIYRYNIIFPNSSLHRKPSEDIVLKYPKNEFRRNIACYLWFQHIKKLIFLYLILLLKIIKIYIKFL